MKKMLIAYYSWSNGNTKRIAEQLQQETGADIVRIETKVPYSGGYLYSRRTRRNRIRQAYPVH